MLQPWTFLKFPFPMPSTSTAAMTTLVIKVMKMFQQFSADIIFIPLNKSFFERKLDWKLQFHLLSRVWDENNGTVAIHIFHPTIVINHKSEVLFLPMLHVILSTNFLILCMMFLLIFFAIFFCSFSKAKWLMERNFFHSRCKSYEKKKHVIFHGENWLFRGAFLCWVFLIFIEKVFNVTRKPSFVTFCFLLTEFFNVIPAKSARCSCWLTPKELFEFLMKRKLPRDWRLQHTNNF